MSSTTPRDQQSIIDELRRSNQRLEMALKENAQLQSDKFYLASIVEFSNDAIVSVNLDGVVTSWNNTAERLIGHSPIDIIGQPVARIFPPDQHAEEANLFARLKRGEVIANYEIQLLRRDGSLVPVSRTASPIRDGDGHILGVSHILHDVTAQKQAREEVRTLQAEMAHLSRWNLIGTMASSLAHELNQPLTATMNYVLAAKHMLGDASDAARASEYLDKAVEETSLAGGIIRSLREFIQKREPVRKPEDINEVLENGLTLSLSVKTEAKKRIRRHLAENLPPVLIDNIQIQQVLLNLVRNGFEAMQETLPGEMVVETALGEQGFVIVSVSDTGPGLAPEVARKLFQPFVTTKQKGMGVGLSICQVIIETHGGRIWAEPNQPTGTIFRFQVPVAPGTDHAA